MLGGIYFDPKSGRKSYVKGVRIAPKTPNPKGLSAHSKNENWAVGKQGLKFFPLGPIHCPWGFEGSFIFSSSFFFCKIFLKKFL
ncbi:MAG: hypothetical protein CM15mV71_250 [Caudoviricetes sp.]|nr:MAG: hypothetical protein CM15mV71_250 [Caudoviricetes sp.]